MKKIGGFLYNIYGFLIFIIIILLLFLSVLFVLPAGKIQAGNHIYTLSRFYSKIWYFLIGIKHMEIYEVPHDRNKQYIFVANHSSYMDVPAIVLSMHQPVRVLGKSEMVRYPVFGWIYRAAVICVDRNSLSNRARSLRALKAAVGHGISVFIFPEGTFNETTDPLKEFYDGAFKIAVETRKPIKPVIFPDNTKRLHWRSIFSLTPGNARTVFLEEIPVHDFTTSKDVQDLKQIVYKRMEQALRKYAGKEQSIS